MPPRSHPGYPDTVLRLSRLSSECCFVIGALELPRDDGDETRLQISHPYPTSISSCTSLQPLQLPILFAQIVSHRKYSLWIFFFFSPPSPSALQLQVEGSVPCLRWRRRWVQSQYTLTAAVAPPSPTSGAPRCFSALNGTSFLNPCFVVLPVRSPDRFSITYSTPMMAHAHHAAWGPPSVQRPSGYAVEKSSRG